MGGRTKGNKPKYQDKEGNMTIAVFKNKNIKGTEYLMTKITKLSFPFKYNRPFNLSTSEIERLKILLARKPKFVIKKKIKEMK